MIQRYNITATAMPGWARIDEVESDDGAWVKYDDVEELIEWFEQFEKISFNFGQRDFAHTPPTGFVALSTMQMEKKND